MKAQPKASHFIDGEYVEDTDGTVIESIYPATGEVIARLHAATPAIVERAIAAAKRAQPEWAAMSPTARGRILKRAADIMRERNRALSELETLDTGKPIQETIVADPTSGADAFEFFGGVAAAGLNGSYIPLGGDFAYTKRVPLGVCVGIGAWNYPQQIACWKGAPALIAGNAMVFKPSENTPLGALKIAEILLEAGLPKGLYNVIQGDRDTGPLLVNHPDVAKVSLTGSVPTGRKVAAAAAELSMCHGTRRQVAADRLRRRRYRQRHRRGDARQFLFDRPGLLERHGSSSVEARRVPEAAEGPDRGVIIGDRGRRLGRRWSPGRSAKRCFRISRRARLKARRWLPAEASPTTSRAKATTSSRRYLPTSATT